MSKRSTHHHLAAHSSFLVASFLVLQWAVMQPEITVYHVHWTTAIQVVLNGTETPSRRPCPVSERLAKQKFSHWGFPVNSNEAEFFFA